MAMTVMYKCAKNTLVVRGLRRVIIAPSNLADYACTKLDLKC